MRVSAQPPHSQPAPVLQLAHTARQTGAHFASAADADTSMPCSAHNPNLRFIPAPKWWLPASHECAELCVHCGHTGEPACPVAPWCRRRRSLLDPYEFMDGPTFKVRPSQWSRFASLCNVRERPGGAHCRGVS